MARKAKTRTAYRDKVTGRFASRATWKRSRVREGTRYKRVTVRVRTGQQVSHPKALPEPSEDIEEALEELAEEEEIEFQGAFDSPGGKHK